MTKPSRTSATDIYRIDPGDGSPVWYSTIPLACNPKYRVQPLYGYQLTSEEDIYSAELGGGPKSKVIVWHEDARHGPMHGGS